VCKTIVGRLSSAISQQEDVGVQLEALDILGKNPFQFIMRHFCLLNHKKKYFKKYTSVLAVLSPKWFPHEWIILAKEQTGHSFGLIYFLIYAYLNILAQSQILGNSL
jgi:hypothetical protein